MDLEEWEEDRPAGDPLEPDFPAWLYPPTVPPSERRLRRQLLAELGRAHLRLRLFRGWSQPELERNSGVDQTTISRFERGSQDGLSIQRLAAMLAALRAARVEFLPPPGPPPTALDLMIHGDRWKRAGDEADRRLERGRRRRAESSGAAPDRAGEVASDR